MTRDAMPGLLLFIALVLSAALSVLAASGHFPVEHRAAPLRSGIGRAILFGACASRRRRRGLRDPALARSRDRSWRGGAGGAALAAAAPRRLGQWTRRPSRLRRCICLARSGPRLTEVDDVRFAPKKRTSDRSTWPITAGVCCSEARCFRFGRFR